MPEYLPSFVWPYGLISRALWLRVCMTGQLHVLMLQPLLETLKHRKKMQQCYDHQHWSAVLWYKDWCQLGQNKLEYHQISRGDVWPPSAQRSGREHGRSTAAQVSAQFQSNRLFLCVRRWNKNKWVTIHQLHTGLLGRLQRKQEWMFDHEVCNRIVLLYSVVVCRKEINYSTYRFFLWKYLHLYFVTNNWGWVFLGTSLQKSQTSPD